MSRIASLAQAGVLLATIAGFYYTVIPLYQKAALDELIAKREVELKDAQAAVAAAKREAYEQQRKNFVRSIEFPAADGCSDIQTSFRQPPVRRLDDEQGRREDHAIGIRLSVAVAPCLASVLSNSKATTSLAEVDARHLAAMFASLGPDLDKRRVDAIAQIADVPALAARDSTMLEPVGPYTRQLEERKEQDRKRLAEVGIKIPALEPRPQVLIQQRIEITQRELANKYRREASQAIRQALRSIQWPIEPSASAAGR